MRKLKLYLETSVWNFYHVEDSPDKQAVTQHFFDSQPNRRFELYISEVVLEEIKKATTPRRVQLLQLIDLHQPKVLALDTTVHQLANAYLAHQILPAKSSYDA
jgi:predicted nucleic acid-binding protein